MLKERIEKTRMKLPGMQAYNDERIVIFVTLQLTVFNTKKKKKEGSSVCACVPKMCIIHATAAVGFLLYAFLHTK